MAAEGQSFNDGQRAEVERIVADALDRFRRELAADLARVGDRARAT